MKNIINKALSIQVSLNGLSFCIKNKETKALEYLYNLEFERKENPHHVETLLLEQLDSETFTNKEFSEVVVVHRNELSTMVPNELYNDAHLADYLKFNAKILKSDFITSDYIEANKAHNVYVPLVNLNNVLLDRFGQFIYKHSSTILVENLLNQYSDITRTTIFINVEYNTFDMVIVSSVALQYINTFEISTQEDLCYYVLFTMEQMQLDREKVPVRFIGGVEKDDDNFKMIYNYVRDVEVVNVDCQISSQGIQQSRINKNYVLIKSLN